MYKIMLGMSYYIHGRGLGALVDGVQPLFKESTEGAVNPLATGPELLLLGGRSAC